MYHIKVIYFLVCHTTSAFLFSVGVFSGFYLHGSLNVEFLLLFKVLTEILKLPAIITLFTICN